MKWLTTTRSALNFEEVFAGGYSKNYNATNTFVRWGDTINDDE